MCLNIKTIYLITTLDYFEYMRMPLSVFPKWIKKQYKLDEHAQIGFLYLQMERAVWGLPQAGILANKLLRKRLASHGYYECINNPGLWRHKWRPITFTLVVDRMIFRLTLKDLGHPQPKTPVHYNNAPAVGISNNTIKRQCS